MSSAENFTQTSKLRVGHNTLSLFLQEQKCHLEQQIDTLKEAVKAVSK